MKVYIEKENKTLTIKYEGKAEGLLRRIGINKEEVIITKNDEVITIDEELKDEDEIRILSVISGG